MTEKQTVMAGTWRLVAALILGGVLVVLCYFFVDRPVAWFLHHHRAFPDTFLWRLAQIAAWTNQAMIAAMIVVLAGALVWGGRQRRLLLAITVSLLATELSKDCLKWAFGRPVPLKWFEDNPSAGPQGVCEFHLFHSPVTFLSFPSGHAAITVAVVSILWLARPRLRIACFVAGGLICVPLVALNYHFVGDVVAGAMLGATIGVASAKVFRIRGEKSVSA